jgi:hypothetical protein
VVPLSIDERKQLNEWAAEIDAGADAATLRRVAA